jgi:hypothetical protein
VGPGAGFVCDPETPTFDGPVASDGEAFRRYDLANFPDPICEFEDPIFGAQLSDQGEFCPCTSAAAPSQYEIRSFAGGSLCGHTATPLEVGSWVGLLHKRIGRWTDPAVYPGTETLLLPQGTLLTQDECAQAEIVHLFRGVHTLFGNATFEIESTLGLRRIPNALMDIGNAIRAIGGGPVVGKRAPMDKLITTNWDI